MYNILSVNPFLHHQPAYALANDLRKISNLLIAVFDSESQHFLCKSRLFDKSYWLPFPVESWKAGIISNNNTPAEIIYIQELLKICKKEQVDIIFPGLDEDLYLLSKNKKIFSENGVNVMVPSFENYLKLVDKHAVIELALKHHFPCAKSYLCATQTEIESVVRVLGYPLVAKQRFSVGTDNVKLIYDTNELSACVTLFFRTQPFIILQEYIPGTKERSLNILIDKNSEIPIAFTLKKVRHLRPSLSTAIEVVANPKEMDYAKEILKTLGCFGFYVFQTKIDERDGQHKLIEINPRFGANHRMLLRFGINMPALLIQSLKDKPVAAQALPIGSRGVALFEDILAFFTYTAYRIYICLYSKSYTSNHPPSFLSFIKSYIIFYTKKPFLDIYIYNFYKDPMATLRYYYYIFSTLKQKGIKRLRFIPWGDI